MIISTFHEDEINTRSKLEEQYPTINFDYMNIEVTLDGIISIEYSEHTFKYNDRNKIYHAMPKVVITFTNDDTQYIKNIEITVENGSPYVMYKNADGSRYGFPLDVSECIELFKLVELYSNRRIEDFTYNNFTTNLENYTVKVL